MGVAGISDVVAIMVVPRRNIIDAACASRCSVRICEGMTM